MASPNSNSHHKLNAFADCALNDDMKSFDHFLAGVIRGAGTSTYNAPTPTPTETTISARVHEKNQNAKLKKKQPVEESRPPSPKRFSISLTKEEIEHDLFIMTGKRPLRCKKKRTKKEQNDFDALLPGSSLDGHTVESLKKSYGTFSSKRY